MKFSILSDPTSMKVIRSNLKNFITSNHLNNIDINQAVLATDEAVQNIIRYAYNMKRNHSIDFHFECKNDELIVQIRDFGKQFPIEQIKPRELKDVKPGGLGVHFIKSICKKVDYKHVVDTKGGTLLTLVF